MGKNKRVYMPRPPRDAEATVRAARQERALDERIAAARTKPTWTPPQRRRIPARERAATRKIHAQEDAIRRAADRKRRLANPPVEVETVHANTLGIPFAASVRRINGTRIAATKRPGRRRRKRGTPVGDGSTRPEISDELRWQVLNRDRHTCRYCRRRTGPFHMDHVIPVVLDGPTTFENLVTACAPCNLRKGASVWTPLPLETGAGV